jgi:hypothetical protein
MAYVKTQVTHSSTAAAMKNTQSMVLAAESLTETTVAADAAAKKPALAPSAPAALFWLSLPTSPKKRAVMEVQEEKTGRGRAGELFLFLFV